MADKFLLEVATPERLLLHEHAADAQIPAANGYLGVLPGHAALLSELGTGDLTFACEPGGHRRTIRIEGGWLEISNDHVRVLASKAEAVE